MASKKQKALYGLTGLVLFLFAVRLALPTVVKWYLNNRVLNQLDSYRGQVDDVDIALIRGAYVIQGLELVKLEGSREMPFIDVPKLDLSIQWKEIWNGAIVGEIIATNPTLNIAFSDKQEEAQTGVEEDWTEVIQQLMPIRINRFAVVEGAIAVVGLFELKDTDFALDSVSLELTNIQNTIPEDADALPSTLSASANATGYGGHLLLDAQAMLLQTIPDFDYTLRLESAQLTALNPFFQHYTGMTFERGTLHLYSEMAMKEGSFKGYFKPILKQPLIFGWKEEQRPVGQWFKEFFSEGVKEVFKNQKKQQVATKIPVEGQVDAVQTALWTSIGQALKNAYIQAFKHNVDESIRFEDVLQEEDQQRS